MTSASPGAGAAAGPPVLGRWQDLVALVRATVPSRLPTEGLSVSPSPELYVLRGRPRPARGGGVHDDESGVVLPGVPALRLTPASWWPGQTADWVARQLVHHARAQGDGVSVPVLRGRVVGSGWDSEPLLGDVGLVAVVPPDLLAHAQRHHRTVSAGRWPEPSTPTGSQTGAFTVPARRAQEDRPDRQERHVL